MRRRWEEPLDLRHDDIMRGVGVRDEMEAGQLSSVGNERPETKEMLENTLFPRLDGTDAIERDIEDFIRNPETLLGSDDATIREKVLSCTHTEISIESCMMEEEEEYMADENDPEGEFMIRHDGGKDTAESVQRPREKNEENGGKKPRPMFMNEEYGLLAVDG